MSKSMELLQELDKLPKTQRRILEIKECSPFGFESPLNNMSLFDRLEPYADVLAVHTDPLYGGDYNWLRGVCNATDKPVLAKGWHPTIAHVQKCLDAGAAYVLTVGWDTTYTHKQSACCWEERIDRSQAGYWRNGKTFVWNARYIRTGEAGNNYINGMTIAMGKNRKRFPNSIDHHAHPHINQLPGKGCAKLIQASCIHKIEDIHPDVDGFIIGTAVCGD